MEQIQLGDQGIRFDKERTRQAYAAMNGGDAERCGCSCCRNFAAQRSEAYPDVFRLLLDQLGIDPAKEGEAYDCGPEGSLRRYGGWLYFVGEFVQFGERLIETDSGFRYWIADGKKLPRPAVDFGPNVLTVEFLTKLPWVITDPP